MKEGGLLVIINRDSFGLIVAVWKLIQLEKVKI